jgi:Coenzyme PQQ synthesis protein D (PqqD)
MALRMAKDLAWQLVDGEGVIVDLERRLVIGLNPTASLIWSLLKDHDEAAIVSKVAERFDVAPDAAQADLREFFEALKARGLAVES